MKGDKNGHAWGSGGPSSFVSKTDKVAERFNNYHQERPIYLQMGFAFEVHAKREGPSKESNDYSPREINNEKLKIKLKK